AVDFLGSNPQDSFVTPAQGTGKRRDRDTSLNSGDGTGGPPAYQLLSSQSSQYSNNQPGHPPSSSGSGPAPKSDSWKN
ncbi:unnamed protein product, partial [Polarella glacialis]